MGADATTRNGMAAVGDKKQTKVCVSIGGAPGATTSTRTISEARAPRGRRRAGRFASALLFQSTALAGSLVGLPMALYSRAYAQTNCSPDVTKYTIDGSQEFSISDVRSMQKTRQALVFNCTISSDSAVSTPQYAYGGGYSYYQNAPTQNLYLNQGNYLPSRKGAAFGWQGLAVTVDNNADIAVSGSSSTNSIIQNNTSSDDLTFIKDTQPNALSVYSRGTMAMGNALYNYTSPVPAGAGGAVSITNSGTVSSSAGAGIYAVSAGNMQVSGGRSGEGGAVTIVTSGDVTGDKGGIIAISQGGMSTIQGYLHTPGFGAGAAGGTVAVTVSGSANVTANGTGPGVFAASYGGNAHYQPNPFGPYVYGGSGGKGGSASVSLGSKSAAMTGTISSAGVGANPASQQIMRKSGAAVAAISQGGIGVAAGTYIADGGQGGAATITGYGASSTLIKTTDASAPGLLAQSFGGVAQGEIGVGTTLKGGDGGTATVTLAGGGSVETSGARSVGLIAQSLGGSGKDDFYYSSGYGRAGAGGKVYVTSDFGITTTGAYAHGIVAQSAAASFATAIYNNASSGSIVWGDQNTISTGSATVSVTNTGTISVSGTDAHGIVAQSIGGGGGMLTSSKALSNGKYGVDTSASQTIGGYAGADGDDVTVVNKGAITTKGAQAGKSSGSSSGGSSSDDSLGGGIAILAQSIGGGGGTSAGQGATGGIGASGGDTSQSKSQGGTVTVDNYAALTTYGAEGHGIVVQSIGGGGGQGRNATGFFTAVGGAGGPGGDGGSVNVNVNDGSVVKTYGDYAVGAVAQSIGGGGGQGGKASSWGLWGSRSVGGSGGNGGDGGTAEIKTEASATIATTGSHALGVYAQSIGGGGGGGGAAKSTSDGLLFSFAIATGGSGGGGGDGADAKVYHSGGITTSGADATGILVQSIGGGGGAGGAATAKAVSEGLPIDEDGNTLSFNVSVAHGGAGASGGDGGDATGIVEDGASVATTGDGAAGLVVQSIGGGGGAGGDSTATSVAKSLGDLFDDDDNDDDDDDADSSSGGDDDEPKQFDIAINVSIGGSAGDGGKSDTAYGHAEGTVKTSGDLADGMLVQSIGGGGGSAGVGKGSASAVKNSVSAALAVTVGGSGGSGGDGGKARGGTSSTGSISTSGVGSRGLVVQSIGGGGGAGGGANGPDSADWNVSIGVGGTGGAAGDGATVYAWNNGPITTGSDFADAILAQSIGGGGGTAGLGTSSVILQKQKDDDDSDDDGGDDSSTAARATVASDDSGSDDYSVQVGSGKGGGGGDGGNVYVGVSTAKEEHRNAGLITVNGALGHGIHAQSIGGGGGKGATQNATDTTSSSSSSGSGSGSDSDGKTASINIGASDGASGSGGSVSVYAGSITTLGFGSSAIVAQSIGGGGGTAVSSGFSLKSLALQIGALFSPSGDQVDGGAATVDISGTVKTSGDAASGVIVQSIGGGGGLGLVALGTTSEVHDDSASDVIAVQLGGGAGGGDSVTVSHGGTINTSGARSIGIVAQSIGGGGGFVSASESNFESVIFSTSQEKASSGSVEVELTSASIVTSGDGGVGIIAQSIGGGGGFAVDIAQSLNVYDSKGRYSYGGGSSGSIGDVSAKLDAKSSIATTGDYAHGIIAQSLGGGGGLFENDGKTYAGSLERDGSDTASGTVTVDVSGTISTKSDNAWAIFAQNQTGALAITVEEGGTVTGSGAAADNGTYAGGAVWATSGTSNADNVSLTISGKLTGNAILPSGQKQYAAAGAAVTGSAPALTGARILTTATGTLVTGAVASADTVLNAGAIDLGGAGNATRTRIDGDLVGVSGDPSSPYSASALGISGGVAQTTHYDGTRKTVFEGGVVTNFDVDLEGGGSDLLVVDGDLAGALGISVNALSLLPQREIELLRVAGAHTAELAVLPGLVFSFAEVESASGRLSTSTRADFIGASGGLTQNQKAVARGLQAAWDALDGGAARLIAQANGPSLGEVFANFHDATPQTFGAMAGELASRIALAPMTLAVGNAIAAADGALDCRGFDGAGVTLTEDGCVWASAYGAYGVYDGVARESGFDARTYAMRVGGQAEVAQGWFLGGLVGYESSVFSGDERPETLDAQSIIAALSLTREFGALEISAVAGGGHTFGSSRRSISGFGVTARADPQSDFLFARLQGAYQLTAGVAYMEPSLAVDVFGLRQAGYRESGAGALDLIVDGESKLLAGLTPALEIGTRVDIVPEVAMRLFAKGGLTFLSDDEFTSDVRFAGLSAMDTFQTTTPIAGTLANIAVGFDVTRGDAFELRVNYTGAFADNVQSHGGTLRLGYRF
ncbi:MAG: autotransporter [Acuticoccus sp.]